MISVQISWTECRNLPNTDTLQTNIDGLGEHGLALSTDHSGGDQDSAQQHDHKRVRKKRELDGLLARDRELDTLFERLYEDNVSGKIDDARFAKMAKRYEQEQGENAGRIKALRLEVKKLEEKRMDVDDFLETVRHYTDAAKITKRMVAELIDHIEVYPAVKEDGVTNQRVTIHYNCIGAFEVPDRRKIPERDILLETRTGVALSYAPAGIAV